MNPFTHTHKHIYPGGSDDLAKGELLLKSSRYAHTDTNPDDTAFRV